MSLFKKKTSNNLGRKRRIPVELTISKPVNYSYSTKRKVRSDRENLKSDAAVKSKKSSISNGFIKVVLYLILIGLVVLAFKITRISPNADVNLLASNNTASPLSKEDINNIRSNVTDYINGSIWNKNKITFSASSLRSQLLTHYSNLKNISVTIPLLSNRLNVYLSPDTPALVFNSGGANYLVDSSGKVISKSSSKNVTNSNLPVIDDQSNLLVKINQPVISGSDGDFIQTVYSQLTARGLKVSSMSLPSQSRELDVHISGISYFVKFNLENNDPKQQAGTYLATIATLQKQNIQPSKYVDVRIDGRAYYQ